MCLLGSLEHGALWKKWVGCRGNLDGPGTLTSTQLWSSGSTAPWLMVVRSVQRLRCVGELTTGALTCVPFQSRCDGGWAMSLVVKRVIVLSE